MNQRAGALALLIPALLILAFAIWTAADNPFFAGDQAMRMHNARYPVFRMGNRVWLPALQAQIGILYRLHAPYWAFKCLPALYLAGAALLIGLIAWQLSGPTRAGFAFSVLVMLGFAGHRTVFPLGATLYQEIVELALFFFLFLAGFLDGTRRFWVVAAAAAALLTRETFWICLFTITLLGWRSFAVEKGSRARLLLLWSVPLLWLLSIPFSYRLFEGRFPVFPVEWPLGINKEGATAVSSLAASASHLWQSLLFSRALYIAGGVLLVWVIGRLWRVKHDARARQFAPFSLISLAIGYTLILLFDPWQATGGNTRIAVPIIANSFAWAALLFGESSSYPAVAKILTRCVLVAALALGMSPAGRDWVPGDYSQARRDHAEIERLAANVAGGRRPNFCFLGVEHFTALQRFVAPALYASRRFPRRREQATPAACDLVIVERDAALAPGSEFTRYKDYDLDGAAFTVFQPVNRRPGT